MGKPHAGEWEDRSDPGAVRTCTLDRLRVPPHSIHAGVKCAGMTRIPPLLVPGAYWARQDCAAPALLSTVAHDLRLR